MNAHHFIEFLKYRWRAKTRHGIHSPFVYAFVEEVVQNRNKNFTTNECYAGIEWPETRYGKLFSRIVACYGYDEVLCVSTSSQLSGSSKRALVPAGTAPQHWAGVFAQCALKPENDSLFLVTDIHKTRQHTKAWQELCDRPDVLMSIDLYGIGLLFFKPEFKEKQHFVLRC